MRKAEAISNTVIMLFIATIIMILVSTVYKKSYEYIEILEIGLLIETAILGLSLMLEGRR